MHIASPVVTRIVPERNRRRIAKYDRLIEKSVFANPPALIRLPVA